MGAELGAAVAVPPELRHRPGLSYPNPLAGNPGEPQFSAEVQAADGSTVKVACPTATRLAVALMNMNAVHGGAATGVVHLHLLKSCLLFTVSCLLLMIGVVLTTFANDAGHTENGIYALKANYGFAECQL